MAAAGGQNLTWGTVYVNGWLGVNEKHETRRSEVKRHSFGIITNTDTAAFLRELKSYNLAYNIHFANGAFEKHEASD